MWGLYYNKNELLSIKSTDSLITMDSYWEDFDQKLFTLLFRKAEFNFAKLALRKDKGVIDLKRFLLARQGLRSSQKAVCKRQ